jgi:la-related protein 1
MFLRKHMDSQGFVYLSVIADFNRLKRMTTDLELIKYVCYHSPNIEFMVGNDGKDRLRRREQWKKFVMEISERDPSAQNNGPEQLQHPPMPHLNGYGQAGFPYGGMPLGSPPGPVPHPYTNGAHTATSPDPSAAVSDNIPNGLTANGVNGFAGSNGHLETTTKAVSGEPDSFSDAQVDSLSVIVRKQKKPQVQPLPPSATRTCSNASIDSNSGVPGGNEKANGG